MLSKLALSWTTWVVRQSWGSSFILLDIYCLILPFFSVQLFARRIVLCTVKATQAEFRF